MKVNKIFHWLYFLMLLLPVFAIPIFAIYTRNENSTFAQEITVHENKVVDFNQLVTYNNDLRETFNGVTISSVGNGAYHVEGTANDVFAYAVIPHAFSIKKGHLYYLADGITPPSNWNTNGYALRLTAVNDFVIWTIDGYGSFTPNANSNDVYLQFLVNTTYSVNFDIVPQLFDVTQMYGVGNEPSLQQFRVDFPNIYYPYTLSDKQLLKNVSTVTYNDTDVGSQFIYTIYNSVDKYFNYDNVLNFGDLYDWLQLNFFNGNAPLGFFIFWHYLIYFLLTSLLWLLFDVLMYVPNLIHKWLDEAS